MATFERSPSALDYLNRPNLLEVVLERSKALKNAKAISFLFYIARLNESEFSIQNSILIYERILKVITVTNKGIDTSSGILLFYSGIILHVIEAPEILLFEIINGITSENLIKNSKVVLYSSNVPFRLFPQFSCQFLNLPFLDFDETKAQEPIEKQISEALAMIATLSKEISKVPRKLLKLFFEELSSKHSDLILPITLIDNLLKSNELFSLVAFQEKQHSSDIIVSESELVWPITALYFPAI
nr:unnamed protein product [Hydra vulgaris]